MDTTTINNCSNDTCYSEQSAYCGTPTWFIVNSTLTVFTILGNLLTISAILLSKKLSSIVANQFIFSLAVSDLMVGLSIPYHMSFYMIEHFGDDRVNCLLRFVLISFACSSSIMNLLYIAADRYAAIVYPLHYNNFVTRRTSIVLIFIGWTISFIVAAVPLVWNDWHENIQCEFVAVLPSDYLYFVLCPMFALIWIMMLLLYSRICREANGHARRLRNATSLQSILAFRDSKSFQVMMTILGCFTVCWLPYFVVTLYARKKRESTSALLYEIAFNLAVANSGMNPVIYAWKNTNFRKAFLCIARCRSPNSTHSGQYVTNHAPNRKNSFSLNGIANSLCHTDDIPTPSGENSTRTMTSVLSDKFIAKSNNIPLVHRGHSSLSNSVCKTFKTVIRTRSDTSILMSDSDRLSKCSELTLDVSKESCQIDKNNDVKNYQTLDKVAGSERPRSM